MSVSLSWTQLSYLVCLEQRVSRFHYLLDINERELECVVAIGPLKTRSVVELVARYEPSTYQLVTDDLATAPPKPVI